MIEKAGIVTLIIIVVVNCGVLFENKPWVRISEWFRIVSYPVILIIVAIVNQWNYYFIIGGALYLIISTGWFFSLSTKKNATAQ